MIDQSRADLTLDEAGKPRLLYHTCQSCGHTKAPDHQEVFEDEGMVAMSRCPCGKSLMTILGSPCFVAWATEALNLGGDVELTHHPVSAAVSQALSGGM